MKQLLNWTLRNQVLSLPLDLSGVLDSFLDSLDKECLTLMCSDRNIDIGVSWHKKRPLSLLKEYPSDCAMQRESLARLDEESRSLKEAQRACRISALRSNIAQPSSDFEHIRSSGVNGAV